MKNIEVLQGKCVDYTFDGQGIVKINNRVIFVPSLLKDEEAEIEILYHKKDFDVGKIKKIIKFSPFRIVPKCKTSTSCGGCVFQNLDYKKQIDLKRDLVNNNLKNIAKTDKKVENFISMNDPYYYRNKVQVPFQYDKQHRLIYGFYKSKTHDVVYNPDCVIEDKRANKILADLRNLFISFNIEPYNEDTRKGFIRHVLIKTSYYYDEIMVVLITNEIEFKNKNNFVKELIKLNPSIVTIIQNVNKRDTNVILGEKEIILYGKGYIKDKLLNTDFLISSKSFYQTNPIQTEKLYSLAIKKANLNKNDVVLDCYCGIGTISLIVSKYVKEVTGVEIVKDAIKDANNNKKLNNIKNVNFICMDAKDYIVENKFDVIFVDPPRKGLEKELIDRILKLNIKKIIYISCDPGTLSRDLNLLKDKYQIDTIDCVDMFPFSFHIETVCSLSLKKSS